MTITTFNAQTGETTQRDATPEEIAARDAARADADREGALSANEQTMRQNARDAFVNLRAYNNLASPTNAQTIAAVKLLCRVAIALIRLQLRELDDTN